MYFDTPNSVYDEMFSIKQKKSTKMTKLPENKWKSLDISLLFDWQDHRVIQEKIAQDTKNF